MPITPKIHRLFHCKQLSELQRWHASQRSEKGVMWIPVDSIAMKHIVNTWLNKFKDKVCNLRLSMAMDGVNLYSLQNTNYYICHIVVINNNIPTWFSVKDEHLMLALLVLGRRQVKNMDVYLQPLLDEFKQLWEGIQVYDVSRPIPIERSCMLYGICASMTHDYLELGVFFGNHVHWFFL